jgi:hypothetical protein
MLIYPQGLLVGERLSTCSDDAQLHFPRLVALGNGFGRVELNARAIIDTAYANFHSKPSREDLTRWLQEYARQHLLFVYEDAQGHPWGQWCGVPARMLPRFKTAADKRSPEPPAEALASYQEVYANAKKGSADFINISADFGNVPKASEELETVPLGIGIGIGVGKGIGVGEEQKQIPVSPEARIGEKLKAKATQTSKSAGETSKPYHPRFLCAYERFPKTGEKAESEAEWFKAVERLEHGEKDKPAMSTEEAHAFLEDAAADFATKTAGDDKKFIRGMRRWLLKSTYLDYSAKPKVVFVEVPDEQWLGGERIA